MKKYDRFQLSKVPASLSREILNRLGVNWKPKHYITSPQCKVCRCPERCNVEELLYMGVEYQTIAAWLKHVGYPDFNPSDISKHYKAHCNWQKEVEERGLAQFHSIVRRMENKELAEKVTGEQLVDAIINRFNERDLQPEDIKVPDALKAAKIQQSAGGGKKDDIIVKLYLQHAKKGEAEEDEDIVDGEIVEEDGAIQVQG